MSDKDDIFMIQCLIKAQMVMSNEPHVDKSFRRQFRILSTLDNHFEEFIGKSDFQKLYGLKSSLIQVNTFCIIVLISQIMAIYYIFNTVTHDRKFGLYSIGRIVLRFLFTFILLFQINADKNSINIQFAYIQSGALGKRIKFYYFLYCARLFLTNACVPILFLFVLTIDKDEEETTFDVVKDFTSLLVLLEIDNYVANGLSRYTQNIEIEDIIKFATNLLNSYRCHGHEPKGFCGGIGLKLLKLWKFSCGFIGNYYFSWLVLLVMYYKQLSC